MSCQYNPFRYCHCFIRYYYLHIWIASRVWVLPSFLPFRGLPAHSTDLPAGFRPWLKAMQCSWPIASRIQSCELYHGPCKAESRGSGCRPATSRFWQSSYPDVCLFISVPHFTTATRCSRKQLSRAVPSTPVSELLIASPFDMRASLGTFPPVSVGGAAFVLQFTCSPHGIAMGMTKTHIIDVRKQWSDNKINQLLSHPVYVGCTPFSLFKKSSQQ